MGSKRRTVISAKGQKVGFQTTLLNRGPITVTIDNIDEMLALFGDSVSNTETETHTKKFTIGKVERWTEGENLAQFLSGKKELVLFEIQGGEIDKTETLEESRAEETTQTSEVINIYAGTNENAELSNFANRPVMDALGVEFKNVEAAFQYAKTNWAGGDNNPNNDSIRMELQTATGAQAKALGRKIKGLDVKAWDQNSEAIMKSIIKDSFEQNPKALEKLLATGNATLTHTQDKSKWGTEFPRILMEVRSELGGPQQTSEVEAKKVYHHTSVSPAKL